jgi:Ca2+-binding EF-hand superfamily protein
MLSPLQQRKIKRLFDVLDVDQDGFLSVADTDSVVLHMARQRGWTQDGPEHRELRASFDPRLQSLAPYRDSNGRVDLPAYLRYHTAMFETPETSRQTVQRLADLVFIVLDVDTDGMVTDKEMQKFYRAYSIDPALTRNAFRKMDGDSDGRISKDEILEAVEEFYLSSDPEAPGNWLLGMY